MTHSANALLVLTPNWNSAAWARRFQQLAPERDIRLWPDGVGDAADIAYVAAWKPPAGALAKLPNLQVIFSLGAGVDHLTSDPALPVLPIVRSVDPDLTARMSEYVSWQVLHWHRQASRYAAQQQVRHWEELRQPAAHQVRVGVMGLGVLGSDAAAKLAMLGFEVAGWSRTAKTLPGIATYHGADGLKPFLARTDILVVLLPLTEATRGIIDRDLLAGLARDGRLGGPVLINAGRGGLQRERDILAALADGTLHGASLDVFETEPLPAGSALWSHPNVVITPHVAAASSASALAAYVLGQIARFERGEALANVIDRTTGY